MRVENVIGLTETLNYILARLGGTPGGGITQLTGAVTAGPGAGSQVASLSTTGVVAGPYGDATNIPQFTVGSDGRISSVTNITIGAGSVTSVDGNSSASGFTLTGGPITTSGTLTFNVSDPATARATLGIGTIYNQTIEDEGTPVTQRTTVNFVGAGVSVADSGGKTTITIAGSVATARSCVIVICAGFTPVSTGADIAELVVPYDPSDGTSVLTWNITRAELRMSGAPSTTQDVDIQKSTGSGVFSASAITTLSLTSGNYEVADTTSLGQIDSGDKVRFSVSSIGTGTGWTIALTLEED